MKAAVLGSGNGGCAAAYDLSKFGFGVRLFDFPEFPENIEAVSRAGGIHAPGEADGFAEVEYAGHDMEKAMAGAELVFAVGPAYSTEPFGKACRQYAKAGQKFIVCPGSCGGGVVFKRALGAELTDSGIVVAETSTLPYAVRVLEPGKIHIYLRLKGGVLLAALPSSETGRVIDLLKPVFPCLSPAKNVLQTALQNANPVIHPTVTLLNAANVERTRGGFLFYEEGVTSAVGNVIEAVDKERIAIGKALGITVVPDPVQGGKQGYMLEENYSTGYSKAPGFAGIKAQSDLRNRYLMEDVGYGLVFFSNLGKQLGVATPVMDSIIQLASVLLKKDFAGEKARTMESMGLSGYSAKELDELL
ncbi:MAG: NAD/NADP octopine/nopaline dehydrogenase family protein [Clostridiales bacterium]|nr:NAD/NADP octopine/nopaline dehydrogenase family protein [Clostridiales bacterium]